MALPTPVGEVVGATLPGSPSGRHSRPPLAKSPDQLLLLGVDADHRLAGRLVSPGLLADVAELGVPVGVPGALDGLGVGLQAEPLVPQQVSDRIRGDPVPLAGQLGRQRPRWTSPSTAAATSGHPAPPARPAPAAPGAARDPGPRPACGPRPAGGPGPAAHRPASSSLTPSDTVASRTPAARATSRIPPCPAPGFGPHQQPPLPLIQMREDRPELRRQHLLADPDYAHAASMHHLANPRLFCGKP